MWHTPTCLRAKRLPARPSIQTFPVGKGRLSRGSVRASRSPILSPPKKSLKDRRRTPSVRPPRTLGLGPRRQCRPSFPNTSVLPIRLRGRHPCRRRPPDSRRRRLIRGDSGVQSGALGSEKKRRNWRRARRVGAALFPDVSLGLQGYRLIARRRMIPTVNPNICPKLKRIFPIFSRACRPGRGVALRRTDASRRVSVA